jgi:hypothetical protein
LFVLLTLQSWRWRHFIPLRCQYTSIGLQGIISQKVVLSRGLTENEARVSHSSVIFCSNVLMLCTRKCDYFGLPPFRSTISIFRTSRKRWRRRPSQHKSSGRRYRRSGTGEVCHWLTPPYVNISMTRGHTEGPNSYLSVKNVRTSSVWRVQDAMIIPHLGHNQLSNSSVILLTLYSVGTDSILKEPAEKDYYLLGCNTL